MHGIAMRAKASRQYTMISQCLQKFATNVKSICKHSILTLCNHCVNMNTFCNIMSLLMLNPFKCNTVIKFTLALFLTSTSC